MKAARVLMMGMVVSLLAGASAAQASDGLSDEQVRAVRPTLGELRWQQIPWLTDLAQAQKTARAEHRPVLLWVTGDDPLERC